MYELLFNIKIKLTQIEIGWEGNSAYDRGYHTGYYLTARTNPSARVCVYSIYSLDVQILHSEHLGSNRNISGKSLREPTHFLSYIQCMNDLDYESPCHGLRSRHSRLLPLCKLRTLHVHANTKRLREARYIQVEDADGEILGRLK